MNGFAPDQRQCTRCREWKSVSEFHDDMALTESRHVCRGCFPDWLDECERERTKQTTAKEERR